MPFLTALNSINLNVYGIRRLLNPSAFVEDVFSTYLYTGTGATQTITNGIDLAGKGGMVWTKGRSVVTSYDSDHAIYDTNAYARGPTYEIAPNRTLQQITRATGLTSFNTTGYTIGNLDKLNTSAATYVSWTFRKQPNFFDVVTYQGNSEVGRNIAHNLRSVPGCIIVKCLDNAGTNWAVYHRSIGNTDRLILNTTNPQISSFGYWNNTSPTSSAFTVGDNGDVNQSGFNYVAYLFAHDAGGFGPFGNDNVISCGSYTGNGAVDGPEINLGWEPQWLMVKQATVSTGNWTIFDNMRELPGSPTSSSVKFLLANTPSEELSTGASDYYFVRPDGFKVSTAQSTTYNQNGAVYVYIAIRRGPMRTPTLGTSVFDVQTTSSVTSVTTTNFSSTVDAYLQANRNGSVAVKALFPRLTGFGLLTYQDVSESSAGTLTANFGIGPQTSVERPVVGGNSSTGVLYGFVRAPGFMDVVTYTGTGANRTIPHNLGVAPELMIIKERSASGRNWGVYVASLGNTKYLFLNTANAELELNPNTLWNTTSPTASVFSVGTSSTTNLSASTYVAYLFATCPGVSKVGSYTGTAALQTINCGFTTGARFILIKRTDNDSDWYTWDSVRGISSGNDPYLLLNTTAGEVTNTNYVDTDTTGFKVTAAASSTVNITSASYIFLAIA